jgi:heme exporter protein B
VRHTLRQTIAILRKDLRAETRNPGILYTMLLFAALLVVVFAFAFYIVDDSVRSYGPGLVWVAVLFVSTLGTSRIFDREQRDGCMDGLLLACADLRAVFYAKCLLSLLFGAAMAALVVPLVVVFFDLAVARPFWLFPPLGLGLIGFCAVGTLFGALMARLAFREVLFPLVVFPLVVPLLICGVKATGLAFEGGSDPEIRSWTGLMLAYDLVFVLATAWLFPMLVRDRG